MILMHLALRLARSDMTVVAELQVLMGPEPQAPPPASSQPMALEYTSQLESSWTNRSGHTWWTMASWWSVCNHLPRLPCPYG